MHEAAQALCLPSINPLLSVWQGWRHNRLFHCGFSTLALNILGLRRKQASTEGVAEIAVGYSSSRPLCKPSPAWQGHGKTPECRTEAPNKILLHFYKSNSRPLKCVPVTSRRLRHSKATDQIPPVILTLTVAGSGQHGSGPTSTKPSRRQEDRSGTLDPCLGSPPPGTWAPPFSQMTAAPLSGHLSFPPPRGEARPTEPPPGRAELRPHSNQTCRTVTSEDCNSQIGERMGKKQRPAAEPARSYKMLIIGDALVDEVSPQLLPSPKRIRETHTSCISCKQPKTPTPTKKRGPSDSPPEEHPSP